MGHRRNLGGGVQKTEILTVLALPPIAVELTGRSAAGPTVYARCPDKAGTGKAGFRGPARLPGDCAEAAPYFRR